MFHEKHRPVSYARPNSRQQPSTQTHTRKPPSERRTNAHPLRRTANKRMPIGSAKSKTDGGAADIGGGRRVVKRPVEGGQSGLASRGPGDQRADSPAAGGGAQPGKVSRRTGLAAAGRRTCGQWTWTADMRTADGAQRTVARWTRPVDRRQRPGGQRSCGCRSGGTGGRHSGRQTVRLVEPRVGGAAPVLSLGMFHGKQRRRIRDAERATAIRRQQAGRQRPVGG